jgi:hypothetical protein
MKFYLGFMYNSGYIEPVQTEIKFSSTIFCQNPSGSFWDQTCNHRAVQMTSLICVHFMLLCEQCK